METDFMEVILKMVHNFSVLVRELEISVHS